jgi:hypothetical protein
VVRTSPGLGFRPPIADSLSVALKGRLRITDYVVVAFWTLAVALFVAAASVAPRYECDDDTHDAYVVAAHRAGIALAGLALALLAAAGLLLGGGIASHGRGRVVRLAAAVISFLLAGVMAVAAFANAVELGCLE